ncbi:DUF4209 domain-containing protein [Catalinimonas niigatensis]|uniref:DUF4209 domain-containing protein n=1 Tax=Catalinimonas niigatensis TaxID=1397264 RepID=UPI0026663F2A|nr:DUF4209 domain-containing protein [Catalinimonas niigatensis]WPP49694.1 DUF4209 domain-containing protein [Catalinimonas niigatensis]
MRSKEIDINQFNTIDEVYAFVDKNAYNLERNWDLTDLWVKYRNKTTSEIEKHKAQWEIDCFLFDIKGDRLFSQIYSAASETGEVKAYPNINDIQKEVIEYVSYRAENSSNPLLKARYTHLLWKCPIGIKHNQSAIAAIDNYVNAIEDYCNQHKSEKHKETPFQIGRLYENLLAVVNEIKTNLEPVKKLTNKLLFDSTFEFYTKHGILNDMLAYPKLFKPNDFENTLSIIENELNKDRKKSDDFSLVNYYIPTAIKIATKTKSDVKKWHNEIGLAYLRIAETETEEDRFWLKLDNYSNAIKAFILSGNSEKKVETEFLYSELKPKVKLPTIRIDFDEETQKQLQEFQDYIKKLAKNIIKQKPEEVYRTISSGFFFPKYADVIKASENKENSFLNFVTTIHFDKNKNITKRQKDTEQEKNLYDTYSYHMRMSVLPYLHFILIPGIKSGNLTFENFIEFIATKSWIGKPHLKYDLGGEGKAINWISLLSPSIVEFFIQIQGWVSSKYYKPSFVLCVDSLTLKFEGLLRNFCERMSIPTSISRQKGMQEAYIHNVLDNEVIKKFFNDDDLLLFNYLFSTDSGLNLRNNVAHCFYDYKEYHPDQMFLLIAALLRLAKYDYTEKINKPSS